MAANDTLQDSSRIQWNFDNRFVRDLPGEAQEAPGSRQVRQALWSPVTAAPVPAPKLLAWSEEMAQALNLSPEQLQSEEFAQVFGGNRLLPGMQSYATRYGGHQFGNWAGQLGDGRAMHLGEVIGRDGQRWDLQLKGAGPTPYSRFADGRAVLRSSIREFLCSEAMHHLGVPTTRALSLVGTGEEVVRDMFYDGNPEAEPGAIVCRVAPSFIRFGHFEILAANAEPELLRQLVDFTIARDFPELEGDVEQKRGKWFAEVCARTARMIAHWMRVGFVHGVMNTDNMSILGLTIDYGPYGWIDNFDPGWTPNTTDRGQKRYRFGQQVQIGYWNLGCLAGALQELMSEEALEAALDSYPDVYAQAHREFTSAKFGFAELGEKQEALVQEAWKLMQRTEVDMTLFYRRLAHLNPQAPDAEVLTDAFYKPNADALAAWQPWLQAYAAELPTGAAQLAERRARMNSVNPIYVLRNYLAQEAIDDASQGDYAKLRQLQQALKQPYTEQPEFAAFASKRPDWARQRAGCSMLSCSS